MVSRNLKRSCICISALFISAAFPLTGFADPGKASSTEPVTTTTIVRQPEGYSSDGQQVVTKPTDPVTVTSAIPEATKAATDPVNTTTRNPTGVSSKTTIIPKNPSVNMNDATGMISGQLSLGFMNGRSKELVYDNVVIGHKNSELDWNLDQVLMLGAGVSVKPLSWLRFNGNIWFKVNDGNGTMDDYDWMAYSLSDWTDWSRSNVSVTEGILFDINTELTFLKFNEASVFAVLGYKHDHWKWDAQGGAYIYSYYYLRDAVGNFPDVTVGTYEQTFDVPYIGIGFRANLDPVTLSGRVIGSTLVSAKDEDHHLLRDLVITSSIDSGKMYGLDFACTYNFTPHLAATAAFQYQKFEELKGDKNWNFFSEGTQFSNPGSFDNESSLVSLSVLFTF